MTCLLSLPMNHNPSLSDWLLWLCTGLTFATYFTFQLSCSIACPALHMCTSGMLRGTSNFIRHTSVQRGNTYTESCCWWASAAAASEAGLCLCVSGGIHGTACIWNTPADLFTKRCTCNFAISHLTLGSTE